MLICGFVNVLIDIILLMIWSIATYGLIHLLITQTLGLNVSTSTSNIPAAPAYGVYRSQLSRYSRACDDYTDFCLRGKLLTSKLMEQGFLELKLKSSLHNFYGRHYDLVDAYVEFARNGTAEQSTTYKKSYASLAIDGDKNQLFDHGSCSHTAAYKSTAWWRLDLGKRVMIHNVVIYYRQESPHRLDGYYLYITDVFNHANPNSGHLCYHDDEPGFPSLMQNRTCNIPGQNVVFYNRLTPLETFVELCEVEVYGCYVGFYGHNCAQECSVNCVSTFCNALDGSCTCKPGYTRDTCDQACISPQFGEKCQSICHCMEGDKCDHISGECPNGCAPGWKHDNCSEACDYGTFGKNCENTCHCFNGSPCDHVNGICSDGCAAGWQHPNCSEVCYHGKFGMNCQHSCHCLDKAQCPPETGLCPNNKCEAGWQHNNCSEKCDGNKFGDACNMTCHCLNGAACNNVNGSCPSGKCADGWKYDSCSAECGFGKFGANCISTCHCLGIENCDRFSGICPKGKCSAGWRYRNCSEECGHGTFGEECAYECHCLNGARCNNVNGFCPDSDCAAGWRPGNCSEECTDSKFGINCQNTCHCLNETSCDRFTGYCEIGLCNRGWNGSSCNEKCARGTYGFNCVEKCTNCVNDECDRVDGKCSSSECKSGYVGEKCNVQVADLQQEGVNMGAVGGGIAVVLIIIIAVAVGIFIFKRRGTDKKDSRSGTPSSYNEPRYDNLGKATGSKHFTKIEDNDENGQPLFDIVETENGTADNVYANAILADNFNSSISISNIAAIVNKKKANKELDKEYEKLKKVPLYPHIEGSKPENKKRNRYLTTMPYDHSRVILKDINGTDYINANFIKNCSNKKTYIATQGPKTIAFNEFWQMVWQENVGKIVMTTQLIEGDKKKCDLYWPKSANEPLDLESFSLTLEMEQKHTVYIHRKIQITHKKTKEKRIIQQFHFTQWPDHGVPDKTNLVKFHRKVKAADTNFHGPLLVHCSAGLGRTGTYIALDALFENGLKTGQVDVRQFTEMMRKDRMNMIQNFEQYKMVHDALVEEFTVKDTSIPVDEFPQTVQTEKIQKEYENLLKLKPQYGIEHFTAGKRPENVTKNVDASILPHDKYRPFLMSYGRSRNDYINAVIIPSYTRRNRYVVTQCPLSTTIGDFWSLIYDDTECCTVVMLEQLGKVKHEVSFIPRGEGQEECYDNFIVSREKSDSHDKIKLNLKHTQHDETRIVSVFVFSEWPSDDIIPPSAKQLVDFAGTVFAESEKTHSSVVVMCRDGCTKSGVFTTISLVIEQINMDGEVDILQAARRAQVRRPEFLSHMEQYELCYQCIEEFVSQVGQESESLYSNI